MTFEKEIFAIYQACAILYYMLTAERDKHVFSDHRNLLFVYSHVAVEKGIGRHFINKVQRWTLYLSRLMYTIEKIEGEGNVTAVVLTRWHSGRRATQNVFK